MMHVSQQHLEKTLNNDNHNETELNNKSINAFQTISDLKQISEHKST